MLQSNKQITHEKLLDKIAKHNSLILLHNLQVFNNKNSKMSKRQKNKMFNTHLINQLVVYYPTFTLLKKKTHNICQHLAFVFNVNVSLVTEVVTDQL